jgi:hypothetical protein
MFWQVKQPGLEVKATQSELDLSYHQHYQDVVIPEAYECLVPGLILDKYSLKDPTLFMPLCDFTTFLAQLWQILPFLFVPCSNLFCIWTYAISIPSPSPVIPLILEGEKFLGRKCFSCSGRFLWDQQHFVQRAELWVISFL